MMARPWLSEFRVSSGRVVRVLSFNSLSFPFSFSFYIIKDEITVLTFQFF
jgi:hypothetical protein